MNLIQIISNNLAHKMVKKVPLDQIEYAWGWIAGVFPQLSHKFNIKKIKTTEELISVYSLAFMFPVGAVFKGLLLVLLSLILGVFSPAIVVVLTFMSLRPMAGGYHFKTYNKCTVISLIQFITTSLIVKYTLQYWPFLGIWYLFIFCVVMTLYIVYRYIPRDTPNKPIAEQLERHKFKRWSLYYLSIWAVLMTIFLLFNIKIIVISSCFGLLLELLSISNIGYNYIYPLLDSKQKP